jgi:hypothetical protein
VLATLCSSFHRCPCSPPDGLPRDMKSSILAFMPAVADRRKNLAFM